MACVFCHIAVQPDGGVHHTQSVLEQWKFVQAAETATWQLQPAGTCHVTGRLWGLHPATLLLHKGRFLQGIPQSLHKTHLCRCDSKAHLITIHSAHFYHYSIRHISVTLRKTCLLPCSHVA